MLAPLPILVVLLCLSVAASDLYARRVPNAWLLLALLLGATWLLLQWALGKSAPPWQAPLGLLVGLLALFPFYAIGWMGAGDVKLFATLGFLLGPGALLPIWLIGSLLAGIHAFVALAVRHRLLRLPSAWGMSMTATFASADAVSPKGRRGTPYAACLAAGALTTVFVPALLHW